MLHRRAHNARGGGGAPPALRLARDRLARAACPALRRALRRLPGRGRRSAAPAGALSHALAVLRVRNSALALALLPAAAAVVLLAAGAPAAARWAAAGLAAVTAAAAGAAALVISRARPAVTPTIEVPERSAPALYALIRDLAGRLDVPAPGAVALTPDCDSWLEEAPGPGPGSTVLVIGSPFLWWMRVGELRALLAPVVAGTGPAAHPDVAAARRCVRAWDAAARPPTAGRWRPLTAATARLSRLLLRAAAAHSAEMERGVAAAASARAQRVDHGLRVLAQEQVGLAYAGWDRLLTRVALPAWRVGRWPARLDAGVVAALTELSRRDRLAEGFAARLSERPACDLLEEPGAMDERISRLAARLFFGEAVGAGRAEAPAAEVPRQSTGAPEPGWAPVDWPSYPREVVDRIWRDRAARLFAALDAASAPTLSCLLTGLAETAAAGQLAARLGADAARADAARAAGPAGGSGVLPPPPQPPRSDRELLIDHVVAAVCCAAADTTGAAPGLDWLDGPVLLDESGEQRGQELCALVHTLVDEGDAGPLRKWLAETGVRPDKPVRLL
ncbi:hypothetical protein RM780_18680 [Streptomyces sp. DSM 44917]|uniref:Integral membrane protein n=1 Tax=Streptomyces boetiae TaxID=3075541 RepID=A0ABU2LBL4_9ACTN|nr:hypothetical protein [Streptomyces sp. DSM 44917]MDT0308973.1 hypothetical protein [Streptomyces sp. DSM 44917]